MSVRTRVKITFFGFQLLLDAFLPAAYRKAVKCFSVASVWDTKMWECSMDVVWIPVGDSGTLVWSRDVWCDWCDYHSLWRSVMLCLSLGSSHNFWQWYVMFYTVNGIVWTLESELFPGPSQHMCFFVWSLLHWMMYVACSRHTDVNMFSRCSASERQ